MNNLSKRSRNAAVQEFFHGDPAQAVPPVYIINLEERGKGRGGSKRSEALLNCASMEQEFPILKGTVLAERDPAREVLAYHGCKVTWGLAESSTPSLLRLGCP